MTYIYYGHHKCASTWIRQIIEQVFREAGYTYGMILDPQSPHDRGPLTNYRESFSRDQLGVYLDRSGLDVLSCITADIQQAHALDGVQGFHVIRDPRDIIVSGYFSHRNSHSIDGLPHYAEHRKALQTVSKEEGLLLEMDFSAQCLQDLGAWNYEQDHILEVKMEDLTTSPYEVFLEIFEFLGLMSWEGVYLMREKTRHFLRTALNRFALRHPWIQSLRRRTPITGEMLLGRVYDLRFEKQARGRKAGQSDPNSHYRKGVAGDWVHHLTPAHVEYFNEKFGDLLIATGYETEPWTVERAETKRRALLTPSL
jgi:hypothetical protein